MIDLLAKGGVLVGPILLTSILALAIFSERLIHFARLKIREDAVVTDTSGLIRSGDYATAMGLARQSATPMGRILAHALEVVDQDRETVETVIIHSMEEEARNSARYLQALATIGNIAPLLGLLVISHDKALLDKLCHRTNHYFATIADFPLLTIRFP